MTPPVECRARFSLEVRWQDIGGEWWAQVSGSGLSRPLSFDSPLALLEWLEREVCAPARPACPEPTIRSALLASPSAPRRTPALNLGFPPGTRQE
ncbi:hypothetical protein DAETH_33010 (plasmid) [Deinococcus aetherius]|uniref:Uncharacterized protein n=1 Tax=Deinococcus aetherius TaxID=200252 RepID=A0ABM8AI05_9DEIO|nr:hypothetical protein [Deinococcus aetherius]BDP43332.1 hypothetical protein DAETH_33010 [Deinococcus aetherius]